MHEDEYDGIRGVETGTATGMVRDPLTWLVTPGTLKRCPAATGATVRFTSGPARRYPQSPRLNRTSSAHRIRQAGQSQAMHRSRCNATVEVRANASARIREEQTDEGILLSPSSLRSDNNCQSYGAARVPGGGGITALIGPLRRKSGSKNQASYPVLPWCG